MNPHEAITRTMEVSPAGAEAAAPAAASKREPTVAAPAGVNLARLQWLVGGAMVLLLLLAGVRLWCVEGLVRTARIEGPSMALALLGTHYRVTCDDCRFAFRCDADHPPESGRVVCPNCGYQANELAQAQLQAGEPVLIDHWPLLARGPRRHEVVAAADPLVPGELVVKRVAALPGERLEIRGGDLFASGRIIRKNLHELREVRVLVHDNDFLPHKTRGLPARWETESSQGWLAVGSTFRHMPQGIVRGGDGFHRLHYQHWRCVGGQGSRTQLSPILDNDSYNQAESRELNLVRDVQLACHLQIRQPGRVAFEVRTSPWQRYVAELDLLRREIVLREFGFESDGKEIARRPLTTDLKVRPAAIEFGLVDQQVLLAIDGRTILSHAMSDQEEQAPPTYRQLPATVADNIFRRSLEIWAEVQTEVEVSHLRVWRDLYYLDPVGLPQPWRIEAPLPVRSFALLGDNAPVSIDSRNWPAAGVPQAAIRGRVTRPFWANQP